MTIFIINDNVNLNQFAIWQNKNQLTMKVIASISWNPEKSFDDSELFNIELSLISKKKLTFKGQLKKSAVVMNYLWHLYVGATNDYKKGREYVGNKLKNAPKQGLRIYQIPVTVTEEKELLSLQHDLERIQEKHFIVNRKEWVSNEQFSTFFGSSNGVWHIEHCNYPPANFIEHIRQTLYEMKENPKIYQWTNAPHRHLLEDWMKTDAKFAKFAKREILPLTKNFWENRNASIPRIKSMLTKIAVTAEKYQRENGIVI